MDSVILPSEEIAGLAAGPAMNALLAEKIMGWERHSEHLWWDAANSQWWSHDVLEVTSAEVDSLDGPGTFGRIASFNPSTNVNDAWQVVEHIFGYAVKLQNSSEGWWFFIIGGGIYYRGEGSTMPLAVCRAALTAPLRPLRPLDI